MWRKFFFSFTKSSAKYNPTHLYNYQTHSKYIGILPIIILNVPLFYLLCNFKLNQVQIYICAAANKPMTPLDLTPFYK